METFTQCNNCESKHDTEEMRWSTVLEDYICNDCWDSDFGSGATNIVFIYPSGDVKKYIVGDLNIIDEYGDDADLPIKRAWVSTDGWRGYYNTTIDGWTSALTGWTTGGWDDAVARRKRLFNQFAEELIEGSVVPPCQVALITDPTSNVFSTAITIQVPEKALATLIEWLDSSEYSADDLTHSLS